MVAISTSDGGPVVGRRTVILGLTTAAVFGLPADAAWAASAAEVDRDSVAALNRLYASKSKARTVGDKALAVLVFPKITKAGFVVGGQGGVGSLLKQGRPQGYFKIAAGSFGLQAGAQQFSYAMFFMKQSALDYLKSNDGWAIGSGPSVVFVDEGFAKTMNTNSLRKDIYTFAFGQKGLMAGLGLEGSKISRAHPKP